MPYKKTNEAWFGDSFNRDATLTAYNCAVDKDVLSALSGTCDSFTITADCALGSDYTVAKGTLHTPTTICVEDISFKSDNNSLYDTIQDIQAQINDLKQNFKSKKGVDELRSALKTLSYKREIE